MTTEAPVKARRYGSRYARHKFVLEGARMVRDAHGNPVGVLIPGKEIQFVDHFYTTSDPEEIAFLDHQLGPDITRADGEILAVAAAGPVEVTAGLSTASAVSKTVYRCDFCGRADFKNPMALEMHRRSHKKAIDAAKAATPAAEGGAQTPP